MSECKEEQAKGKRQSIPLDVKIQVLDRLDKGERQVDIGSDLHLPTSTIRTILKNKDEISTSATTSTASSAKKITLSRSYALEEMEKRLSIWIDDELERNMPLSQAILMEKAKSIYAHRQSKDPDEMENFAASRGWFGRFKKRYNLYNLKITGEVYVVDRGSYPPEVVFNVDKTGLFWKRIPSRTFISREQKRAPGFKAVKDRLTLLLGGNASGDFRIKPLLVYHYQTPRAMRDISKSSLPVIWKRYCRRKGLEENALLIMDNTPSHPTNLAVLPTCIPVEVLFLPPNTMSLIQPMDQGVIATYLRRTFHQLIEHTDREDNQSMLDFWKQYHIMKAVSNIDLSCKEVTQQCLKAVWKKIWPELCEDVKLPEPIIAEIVDLVTMAGLGDTDAQDIEQLVQASDESLNNEDLEELAEQGTQKPQDTSDSDTEPPKELSSERLNRALHQVNDIMDELVANDPDATRSRNPIVLGGVSCYRNLLDSCKKHRQMTLDQFVPRKTRQEEDPGASTSTI
ncbi:tigger transposable element-derived 1-like [Pelobates cultripes]|uniref:Tigger transposable element-derived 1-like n=1 Tax=Pelobates cultripes TaxID=61616 RepID=A0AAD1WID6_PELCU|nr:tigger transposable element-derived 1-like [Pelobates cultripes]